MEIGAAKEAPSEEEGGKVANMGKAQPGLPPFGLLARVEPIPRKHFISYGSVES